MSINGVLTEKSLPLPASECGEAALTHAFTPPSHAVTLFQQATKLPGWEKLHSNEQRAIQLALNREKIGELDLVRVNSAALTVFDPSQNVTAAEIVARAAESGINTIAALVAYEANPHSMTLDQFSEVVCLLQMIANPSCAPTSHQDRLTYATATLNCVDSRVIAGARADLMELIAFREDLEKEGVHIPLETLTELYIVTGRDAANLIETLSAQVDNDFLGVPAWVQARLRGSEVSKKTKPLLPAILKP